MPYWLFGYRFLLILTPLTLGLFGQRALIVTLSVSLLGIVLLALNVATGVNWLAVVLFSYGVAVLGYIVKNDAARTPAGAANNKIMLNLGSLCAGLLLLYPHWSPLLFLYCNCCFIARLFTNRTPFLVYQVT